MLYQDSLVVNVQQWLSNLSNVAQGPHMRSGGRVVAEPSGWSICSGSICQKGVAALIYQLALAAFRTFCDPSWTLALGEKRSSVLQVQVVGAKLSV